MLSAFQRFSHLGDIFDVWENGSSPTDGELREDLSFELREDGGFELRDG